MSERLKRILQIVGFIVAIIAIGFAIWWFFFKPIIVPRAPTPTTPPILIPPAGLPTAPTAPPPITVTTPPRVLPSVDTIARGGATQTSLLTQTPILSPFLSADGTTIQYYNRADGKFYRVRPDGTVEALSDKVFFNVSNVTWAPDRNQAILEYPDGSNILYNFESSRQTTLPRHWQQFDFSPQSDSIAFLSLGLDQDSQWLAVASADGSQSKPIEPLGENASKVQVDWSPNNQMIAFSRTGFPQSFGEQEIFLVGQRGENFRSLTVQGVGFKGQWSPDGNRILYSAASAQNEWKPEVWIVDGSPDRIGVGKTTLGLSTWVDKCSFSGTSTVFCAVPQELPRGVGLYPQAAGNVPDHLWRVDLQTGERQRIAIPSENHTIDRIVVSDDEQYLYFTDKISGQLYKIDLQ